MRPLALALSLSLAVPSLAFAEPTTAQLQEARKLFQAGLDREEKGIIAEGAPDVLAAQSRDPRVIEFLQRGDRPPQ